MAIERENKAPSESSSGNSVSAGELKPTQLRWQCDASIFPFDTTADVEPLSGVIGQDTAIEALRFGLECHAPGQNIFVRGLTGTGRMTVIQNLLEEIMPSCPLAPDRVYAHDFEDLDRPQLLTLPRGSAQPFAKKMDELADFIRDDLQRTLFSETFRQRIAAVEEATNNHIKQATQPLEQELQQANLALVTVQAGEAMRPAIFPKVDGKPVPPEAFETQRAEGQISDEQYQQTIERIEQHTKDLDELSNSVHKIMEQHFETLRKLTETETREILRPMISAITRRFTDDDVASLLSRIVNDLIENHLDDLEGDRKFIEYYRVNPVLAHHPDDGCPVVVENTPTLANLIGGIDRKFIGQEEQRPDHLSIRGGAILRADGGYLILDARDLLTEPGAWRVLIRMLRTGELEITAVQDPFLMRVISLKPEPIKVQVKVILVGDPELFYLLDGLDPDFPQLFKVLAEFDDVIERSNETLQQYARVIARIGRDEKLLPFHREAVAELAEHGARVASRNDRLTTRFSRIADIAREAAYLAQKSSEKIVQAADVRETIQRTKRRGNLASRKFRELLADGTIQVQTTGSVVGQINGLAVIQAGPLTYGFPNRITASIGAGTGGVINIEGESALSGAIHTKGFHILSGLLRNLLRTQHPLEFDASVTFEQSYGGIDGDSASGAEIICLLSALTDIPTRQDIAMTGAIDQNGAVMAVGGINEKIEGFFDTCRDVNLTGTQGVLIPATNANDLMLRQDVVDACTNDKFHVHTAATIHDAISLMLDTPAEKVIDIARNRAREYWEMSRKRDK